MNNITTSHEYVELINTLKIRVREAQYGALKSINRELINLYWDIGKTVVEKAKEQNWGDKVVDEISKDLQMEFPGIRGYARRNLYNMRTFYLTYKDNPIMQSLIAQLPWTLHLKILDSCKSDLEREFYIKYSVKNKLTSRRLVTKIKENEYERFLANQTNFELTLEESQAIPALGNVKDDYNLDFVGLEDEHTERELENAIILNIVKFLKEMGGYFSFVDQQAKVVVSEDEYYIDLLFYNRQLKCLVAIDLKAGEFKPEYAGKMQFYLSALDDQYRLGGETPSIGIIVCKSKDRTKVEYTLRDQKRPIGVATYNQYSQLEDVPTQIAKFLPSEEEITKRLGKLV